MNERAEAQEIATSCRGYLTFLVYGSFTVTSIIGWMEKVVGICRMVYFPGLNDYYVAEA